MKIYMLSFLLFSSISYAEVLKKEVTITKAIKRETVKSVNEHFNYNNKEVQDVWGLRAFECLDEDECLYYVDSYVNAQVGYTYQYGLHECRTTIKKKGRKLVEDGSDCEFIND